jgi:hypothetical protein
MRAQGRQASSRSPGAEALGIAAEKLKSTPPDAYRRDRR